jgi:hypothetical protein
MATTNITIIFQNGTRETFNNVADDIAWSRSKLTAFLVKKYNNPNIMDTIVDVKRDPAVRPTTPTATVPGAPTGQFKGDQGRWEDLGTGYLHNIDTNQVKLK